MAGKEFAGPARSWPAICITLRSCCHCSLLRRHDGTYTLLTAVQHGPAICIALRSGWYCGLLRRCDGTHALARHALVQLTRCISSTSPQRVSNIATVSASRGSLTSAHPVCWT